MAGTTKLQQKLTFKFFGDVRYSRKNKTVYTFLMGTNANSSLSARSFLGPRSRQGVGSREIDMGTN